MNHFQRLESRRLFAAGDVDPTFGTGGGVDLPDAPTQIVPLSGGKVLLVQRVLDTSVVERRNTSDFSIDTAFGSAGSVRVDSSLTIHDAIQLASGKVMLAGNGVDGGDAVGFLMRLDTDGTPDATFGTNGLVTYTAAADAPLELYIIRHLVEQSDGKIVFNGFIEGAGTVKRVNADGSPDSSFIPFKYDEQSNNIEVQLQSNGKVILGGLFRKAARGLSDQDKFFSLARLNTNGTLDTTFGDAGYVPGVFRVVQGRGVPEARSFLVLSDERILQGGSNGAFATLRRYTANGALDATFGASGVTEVDFGVSTIDTGAGFENGQIVILPDGKILAKGSDKIARFTVDGAWDESFGRAIVSASGLLTRADGGAITIVGGLPDATNTAAISRAIRLQGANGGPAGAVSLAGGVVTVTATDNAEQIRAFVGDAETDDVVSVTVDNGVIVGHVYEVADVTNINITAGGGNDTVFAVVGTTIRSSVSGGSGNDILVGGSGEESLSGNAGRDDISGGAGNDRLAGNGGRDKLSGGTGDDRLFGGASGDWLAGQQGDDQMAGEGGADRLYAVGGGADFMHGNAGDDFIFGIDQTPDDQIFGDGGRDTASRDVGDILSSIEVVDDDPGS